MSEEPDMEPDAVAPDVMSGEDMLVEDMSWSMDDDMVSEDIGSDMEPDDIGSDVVIMSEVIAAEPADGADEAALPFDEDPQATTTSASAPPAAARESFLSSMS
jgi:hypothetical protein